MWKDSTSYSQNDAERTPRVWCFDVGDGIKITVHKYFGMGDTWFLTCKILDISMKDLKTEDIDDAKGKALSAVYSRLNALASRYKKAALAIEGLV